MEATNKQAKIPAKEEKQEQGIFLEYRISSYSCRGNCSFLNSSSEETIQGEETNQGRKQYEEIRYF